MPRTATIAIVPRVDGAALGAVLYDTRASGATMTVSGVFDAACRPLSAFQNVSNPDAARGVVGQYETVRFTFPVATVAIMLAYGEGAPVLVINAQIV